MTLFDFLIALLLWCAANLLLALVMLPVMYWRVRRAGRRRASDEDLRSITTPESFTGWVQMNDPDDFAFHIAERKYDPEFMDKHSLAQQGNGDVFRVIRVQRDDDGTYRVVEED